MANASAIGIAYTAGSAGESGNSTSTEEVAHAVRALLSRADESTSGAITGAHLSNGDRALVATTAFFLIAKAMRVLFYL